MQVRIILSLIFFKSVVGFSQSDSVITLSEVLIENKGGVTLPISSSQTSYFTDYKRIKENAAKNVAEASAWLPGVYLQDYGGVGGLKTISSRGLASSYTRVFIDGVEFQNFQTGQVDLGKIPISNVSKITLVNGVSDAELLTASSYNSPNSVYVETDRVTENKIKTSLGVGSFGLLNPALTVQRKIGERQSLSVGTEMVRATGGYEYELVNGNDVTKQQRVHAGITRLITNFKYNLSLTDSQFIAVGGYWNYTSQELPGAVILYQPQLGQNLFSNDIFLTSSYKSIVSEKWRLKSVFSFTSQGLVYEDTIYHNQAGFLKNEYQNTVYYTSLSSHYQLIKSLSLNSAIDVRYGSLGGGVQVSRIQSFISNEVKYKCRSCELAVYGLFQGVNDVNGTLLKMFNYGVSSSWFPFKKSSFQLHGSYSKNQRIPTFQELYFQRVFVNLVPEKSEIVYAGFGTIFNSKKRTFQAATKVDFFINQVKDKIVSLPTQNLFVWSTRNLGQVQIRGVEPTLQLNWSVDSNWSIDGQVSYTYQQVLDVTSSDSRQYRNQIAYTPFEIIKANVVVSNASWSFSWGLMYNGFRYSLGENVEANLLPSWSLHNVSLAKKLKVGSCDFDLQVSVKNMFDSQYSVIKSFPMPGRNYLFTLSVEI